MCETTPGNARSFRRAAHPEPRVEAPATSCGRLGLSRDRQDGQTKVPLDYSRAAVRCSLGPLLFWWYLVRDKYGDLLSKIIGVAQGKTFAIPQSQLTPPVSGDITAGQLFF